MVVRNRDRGVTGLLKTSARRRKLSEREPEVVYLLNRTRTQKRVKGKRIRSRNGMSLDFAALTDLAFCLDCRYLVEAVSTALAVHFRESIRKGRTADNRHSLPEITDSTKARRRSKIVRSDDFGWASGVMANYWGLGRISGNARRASRLVKPYGGSGRSFMLNRLLRRPDPVDFQTIDGAAAEVIRDTFQWYMRAMGGHDSSLYAGPDTKETTLNRARMAKQRG